MTNGTGEEHFKDKVTEPNRTVFDKLNLWVQQNKGKSFLLVIFLLLFFSRDWDGKISWKEEVQLPDGEIILVKRWVNSSWSQGIGGTGTFYLEGGRLEVLSDIADKPGVWEFPALPVLMYRDPSEDNLWTIVATWPDTYGQLPFYKAPYPSHMYVMHRYISGKWEQVEMDLKLIESRAELNFIREINFKYGMDNLTLSDKQLIIQKPHHPRYRCITERNSNFQYKDCKSNNIL